MMMFNIPSFIINNFATLNTANNYIIFCSCSDVRAKLMHRKVFTNYEYNIINKGVRDCEFGCLLFNHATTEPIYLKLRKLKVEERLYLLQKKTMVLMGFAKQRKSRLVTTDVF